MMKRIFGLSLGLIFLIGCEPKSNIKIVYSEALKKPASQEVDWAIIKWQDTSAYWGRFETYKEFVIGTNFFVSQVSLYELRKYHIGEIKDRINFKPPIDCRRAFDKDTNTYWEIEGEGIGEYVILSIDRYGPFNNQKEHKILRKDGAPYRMKIYNGNPSDFYGYSRPKVITLEIYETAIYRGEEMFVIPTNTPLREIAERVWRRKLEPNVVINDIDDILEGTATKFEISNGNYVIGTMVSYVTNGSLLLYQKDFVLEDKPDVQIFDLDFPDLSDTYGKEIELPNGTVVRGGNIGRIVIKDVYPGKKSKKVCISEIQFVYEEEKEKR
jgi:hypothetical protein